MGRILVIDDEPAVRIAIKRALETDHHEVVLASNGLEALQRYQESPPDLVIADLFMPVMDGIETIRELRRQ
ncbi:MAG: response regulator, partial [Limisphaerales bacterium]